MGSRPPSSRGQAMREDRGGVFTPIPRLHEGRLCARTGGSFHPHPPSTRGQGLTFPPQGGRDGKEGAHKGRPYGGRVVPFGG